MDKERLDKLIAIEKLRNQGYEYHGKYTTEMTNDELDFTLRIMQHQKQQLEMERLEKQIILLHKLVSLIPCASPP